MAAHALCIHSDVCVSARTRHISATFGWFVCPNRVGRIHHAAAPKMAEKRTAIGAVGDNRKGARARRADDLLFLLASLRGRRRHGVCFN